MTLRSHRTKIVATIGPACDATDTLRAMIESGMDIARLNFSHGTQHDHAGRIERLRAAATATGREVAILGDLPGPKIRIGSLATEPIELRPGETLILTVEDVVGTARRVSVNFPQLPGLVRPGDVLYLNDGLVGLQVVEVECAEIQCLVVSGGPLYSRKGLNLPGIHLGVSAFTKTDHRWLRFALAHGVDALSQSFVESAADVEAVRAAATELGHSPLVIAKIERLQAVQRIDEILAAADGIMVARGDLGVEARIEQIAILQKDLIRRARQAGRPVITATQMLESMIHSRYPTRAEATDVANAILDGTDCVMLSAESAAGQFPVEAVRMLASIATATEIHRSGECQDRAMECDPVSMPRTPRAGSKETITALLPSLLASSIDAVLRASNAAAVVILPGGQSFVRDVARLRVPVWVVALDSSVSVCRRMAFWHGVTALPPGDSQSDSNAAVRAWIAAEGLAGDLAVVVHGPSKSEANHNIRLELLDLNVDQPAPSAVGPAPK